MDIGTISKVLRPDGDGIWISPRTRVVPYLEGGHQEYAQVEERSFWFQHRNRVITAVVERFPPAGFILDVGGGNGFVALGLQRAGFDVCLLEPGADGAATARARGLAHVIRSSLEDAELEERSIPAASLFDVVEHIEDDLGFLRSLRGALAPGGRLYVAVPTYAWLWSHEDVIAEHCRRYTTRSLAQVCERAGFAVEFATYFFWPLPAPIWMLRALPHRLGRSASRGGEGIAADHGRGVGSAVVERLLAPEVRRIRSGSAVPFGSSCIVVARNG